MVLALLVNFTCCGTMRLIWNSPSLPILTKNTQTTRLGLNWGLSVDIQSKCSHLAGLNQIALLHLWEHCNIWCLSSSLPLPSNQIALFRPRGAITHMNNNCIYYYYLILCIFYHQLTLTVVFQHLLGVATCRCIITKNYLFSYGMNCMV